MKMNIEFSNREVEIAFNQFETGHRQKLLKLRELIFNVAENTKGVGKIQECLKWGQPAYLTSETKSGSTIRLGMPKQGGYAIYAHCQTSIISDFKLIFGDDFEYDGNRAVIFNAKDRLEFEKIELLIKAALSYHLK